MRYSTAARWCSRLVDVDEVHVVFLFDVGEEKSLSPFFFFFFPQEAVRQCSLDSIDFLCLTSDSSDRADFAIMSLQRDDDIRSVL